MRFRDRTQAGRELAKLLRPYRDTDAVVYALPRGGVPVAAEVAKALDAPLDLVIPRKVGHPASPEYAIAAVDEDGGTVENPAEVADVDPAWFRDAVRREVAESKRRRREYLGDREPVSAAGKTAVVVDDGIATGLTMQAALKQVRKQRPKELVLAVPVLPAAAVETFTKGATVVAVERADPFLGAIGAYYDSFDQVSDDEVVRLLSNLR